MKYTTKNQGIVLLEDGTVFMGKAAGAAGTATGEICFNTGMTGYQEIFTDPSYYGQILTATVSHIGNYGIAQSEIESEGVKIAGLVCKKFSEDFSRPFADKSLQDYFEQNNIVAVTDVDTRALVRHIRNRGAMNAIISSVEFDVEVLKKQLAEVPSMEGLELVSKVSTKESYEVGEAGAEFRVALIDLGTKTNIVRCLVERNCFVKVFPYNTPLNEILDWKPDGIQLSNGPGDPSPLKGVIENVKKIIELEIPVFGICLGHQILALAQGLTTSKMHNGHRGINHPVKNLLLGHCEVTSQNHGFVVDRKRAEDDSSVEITHVHLNDQTLAGLRLINKPAFSVQYHPESSPGPLDSRYLFDEFTSLMRSHKNSETHEFYRQYQRETNT
jgi:carbamoyl-phosphate synthase small subunit